MHDCPECGEACDCDGEDLHHDNAPSNCAHICGDNDDDNSGDPYEPYDDDPERFRA